MQIINSLLQSTPENVRQNYKSHLRLHLKQIMTGINKARLQDQTKVEMRQNKCILSCYTKAENILSSEKNQQSQSTILAMQELRDCKQSCQREQQAVRKHLDDINFYSKRKFAGCRPRCEKKYEDLKQEEKKKSGQILVKQLCKEYNQCMWDCYNRLDRRYKQYWREQQNQIIKEYL